jgi:hypothetical protein
MPMRRQLAIAVAILLLLTCAGLAIEVVAWSLNASAKQANVSSLSPPIAPTQPDFTEINQQINSLRHWTVWKGSWEALHPGLRGKGESDAEFDPDLSDGVRITFTMNVVEGMRPRIFLEGPGIYFGNEGFTSQLFIFGPAIRDLQGNPVPYKNGQTMQISITIGRGLARITVDQNVITCRCKRSDRIRLRLEGGDNWSHGTTEFGNINVQPVDAENPAL